MEINIELLEEQEAQAQSKNINVNKRYLNNILGFHQSEQDMTPVREADDEEEE